MLAAVVSRRLTWLFNSTALPLVAAARAWAAYVRTNPSRYLVGQGGKGTAAGDQAKAGPMKSPFVSGGRTLQQPHGVTSNPSSAASSPAASVASVVLAVTGLTASGPAERPYHPDEVPLPFSLALPMPASEAQAAAPTAVPSMSPLPSMSPMSSPSPSPQAPSHRDSVSSRFARRVLFDASHTQTSDRPATNETPGGSLASPQPNSSRVPGGSPSKHHRRSNSRFLPPVTSALTATSAGVPALQLRLLFPHEAMQLVERSGAGLYAAQCAEILLCNTIAGVEPHLPCPSRLVAAANRSTAAAPAATSTAGQPPQPSRPARSSSPPAAQSTAPMEPRPAAATSIADTAPGCPWTLDELVNGVRKVMSQLSAVSHNPRSGLHPGIRVSTLNMPRAIAAKVAALELGSFVPPPGDGPVADQVTRSAAVGSVPTCTDLRALPSFTSLLAVLPPPRALLSPHVFPSVFRAGTAAPKASGSATRTDARATDGLGGPGAPPTGTNPAGPDGAGSQAQQASTSAGDATRAGSGSGPTAPRHRGRLQNASTADAFLALPPADPSCSQWLLATHDPQTAASIASPLPESARPKHTLPPGVISVKRAAGQASSQASGGPASPTPPPPVAALVVSTPQSVPSAAFSPPVTDGELMRRDLAILSGKGVLSVPSFFSDFVLVPLDVRLAAGAASTTSRAVDSTTLFAQRELHRAAVLAHIARITRAVRVDMWRNRPRSDLRGILARHQPGAGAGDGAVLSFAAVAIGDVDGSVYKHVPSRGSPTSDGSAEDGALPVLTISKGMRLAIHLPESEGRPIILRAGDQKPRRGPDGRPLPGAAGGSGGSGSAAGAVEGGKEGARGEGPGAGNDSADMSALLAALPGSMRTDASEIYALVSRVTPTTTPLASLHALLATTRASADEAASKSDRRDRSLPGPHRWVFATGVSLHPELKTPYYTHGFVPSTHVELTDGVPLSKTKRNRKRRVAL